MAQKIQVDGKDAQATCTVESRRDVVNIVVMGESGVGKSALVQELIGKNAIRKTKNVEVYPIRRGDIEVKVFDTPGLFDPRLKNSDIFKEIAYKTGGKIDLVVYCHDMRNRLKDSDVTAISYFAETLYQSSATDRNFWEYVLYVLTFANKVEEDLREEERDRPSSQGDQLEEPVPSVKVKFVKLLQEYGETLHELIHEKKLPNAVEIAKTIPVVPAGYRKVPLPDYVDWLTTLWKEALSRIHATSVPAFIDATALTAPQPEGVGPVKSEIESAHRNLDDDEIQKCLRTSKRAAAGGSLGIALAVCMVGLIAIARAEIGTLGEPESVHTFIWAAAIAFSNTKIDVTGIGAAVIATLSTKTGAIVGGTVGCLSGAVGVGALIYAAFNRWRAHCLMKKQ